MPLNSGNLMPPTGPLPCLLATPPSPGARFGGSAVHSHPRAAPRARKVLSHRASPAAVRCEARPGRGCRKGTPGRPLCV